jgi:hypothetical protein
MKHIKKNKMKKVYIKAYGWIEVLEQKDNYSLCILKSGSVICFNTSGYKFKN